MTYIIIYHPEWVWILSAPSFFLPTMQLYCPVLAMVSPCGWIIIINSAITGCQRSLPCWVHKDTCYFYRLPVTASAFHPGLWWSDGFVHKIQISVGRNMSQIIKMMFVCDHLLPSNQVLMVTRMTDDVKHWTPHMKGTSHLCWFIPFF